MGFRICYLASKASPDELATALSLELGQEVTEMPDGNWWIAHLKQSGWTLLWSEDEAFGRSSLSKIAALSNQFETVLCEVNETCMWSSSEYWQNGRQLWKVTHAGDGEDRFDLSEIGVLPDGFSRVKDQHFAAQKGDRGGVDFIFEIPLDVAAQEIGFRHEEYLQADDVDTFFLAKMPASPVKKGLISRFLGR